MSETRERILCAAAELWYARSYDGIGVAEICERADVRKGSFFHFFRSKEDLLLVVLERQREALRETMLRPAFAPDVPPLERFRRYFAAAARQMGQQLQAQGEFHGCPIGNVASELGTRSQVVREKAREVFEEVRGVFLKTLREGVRAGEIPAGYDCPAGAMALLAFSQGLAILAKTYNDPRRFRGVWKQAFLAAGLPAASS